MFAGDCMYNVHTVGVSLSRVCYQKNGKLWRVYRYLSKHVTKSFFLFLIGTVAILFVHSVNNENIPCSLFLDEASIGYNAALIVESGHDESGKFLPVFFGPAYKSPLYFYTVAVVFKIFGVSIKILRSVSTLYYAIFFISFIGITRELYGKRKLLLMYSMISAGFIPWFFTVSRISFEVNSQLATISVAVYLIIKTFHSNSKNTFITALLAGTILGLSIYSYQTAKLLTPLLFLLTCVLYARKSTLKRSVAFVSTFALMCVPYIYFTVTHPGGLTKHFKTITYVYDNSITFLQKTGIFLENYWKHVSPSYLLQYGDGSMRHATGYYGQIFAVVLLLSVIGLVFHIRDKRSKITIFLMANLAFAPVAAAFTNDGIPHGWRSILLGFYILIFSVAGFHVLQATSFRFKKPILCAIFALLIIQSGFYTYDYFTRYARQSAILFGSYGMEEGVLKAAELNPDAIIVSKSIYYASAEFLRKSLKPSVTYKIGNAIPEPNSCLVYHPIDDWSVLQSSLTYQDLTIPNAFIRTRCYFDE